MADLSFLDAPSIEVAPRLLGCVLEREIDGRVVRARIVETESYDMSDEASHSFRGVSPRTAVMFGPSGFLYVYFTYGMHYCCNVVTGMAGDGSAVLIRALEPLEGEEVMRARRGPRAAGLTDGPAKLCQALGIDRELNGHDLRRSPLRLIPALPLEAGRIVTSPRIGISRAKEALRRFHERDNPYVSRHP